MSEPLFSDRTVGAGGLTHGTGRVLARVNAGETPAVTGCGEPVAVVISLRRPGTATPSVGYATSGDPLWASRADENLGELLDVGIIR
ncbi:type II toxin-antitoxin system prevent-host-death family antitoxin [Streptosporangium lutulentum]|uniref:Antitoxin (DNA-binding transcriptional repressor) of toxin-antitoxin stability system n=1 Tax=Streptosporangium lutulentum TaxID=1461250 RepID=A0ABT9QKA8_9ACTN|nr:type II toxin-antitoxin system prevent-host-death family antitoxin [Streptosporangium lutulentum]MDP9846484.1 antitoxin (DNA-binding transcriptional repressor) of toxin-antitoxin stability system [Streptosporangium lutulentum]